jgi:gliding motility-associated-like protein
VGRNEGDGRDGRNDRNDRNDSNQKQKMKENKNIEELFRQGFESFEVQPSPKVWSGIRQSVFLRNFLHFSPWSLNAWYAGGVLIIGSALIFSLPGSEKKAGTSDAGSASAREIIINSETGTPGNSEKGTSAEFNTAAMSEKKSTMVQQPSLANRSRNVPGMRLDETTSQQNAAQTVGSEERQTESQQTAGYSGNSLMAWFKSSCVEGCAPLKAQFSNYSQNALRYSWSFGDGGSSDKADPSYIFDEPGTWFVTLTAWSADNQVSVYTDSIRVNPVPDARFSMDVQGDPGNGQPVYFYNYSRGAETYLWDFGDGTTSVQKEPDHNFTRKTVTDIRLLAISAQGCADTTILKDAFRQGEPVFIFPTAFSPNTNGPGSGQYSKKNDENDVFYPHVTEEPEEYQLRIFNRAGILIFETSDIHTGWDGYYREMLMPQGVYVWKARAKFTDGRSVVKMGDVTLLWGN